MHILIGQKKNAQMRCDADIEFGRKIEEVEKEKKTFEDNEEK